MDRTQLTLAQRRFAEKECATPGLWIADGVLLYRETPWATYRWLVNRDGRCLDSVTFVRAG
jgi:hypothetical protein